MKIKNITLYLICTLLASIIIYYSASFIWFITYGWIISGLICAIFGTANICLSIISGLICLVASYISGGIEGFILYSFIVVFGVITGILLKNKCTTMKIVLLNSAGCLISCVSYITYISYISGTNAILSYVNYIKPEFIEMMNEYVSSMGLNDYAAVITEFVDAYFVYVQNMLPSIFVVIALIFAFFSAIIISVVLKFSGKSNLFKFEFSKFMCDKTTTIVFFISFVCSMLMKNGVLQTVFMNIFVILLFVFQVCGFSLIDYFLKKKSMPMGVRVLILFVCFLFTTSLIMLFALIITAILDSFKNYRKIGVDSNINGEGCE